MSLSSTIKSFLVPILRLFYRLGVFIFLVALPITIFPLLSGISGGIAFHFWNQRQVVTHTNSFTLELESNAWRDYWNVPGALTVNEYFDQRAPFHISRLTTSDWHEKLGLIPPNEHQLDTAAGIDKLVSLDGLVRSIGCSDHGSRPTRYWVYVTSIPEWRSDTWDHAFSALLERLYAHPLPADTAILYLDCVEAGFLCGVWGVKYPSLVHFTIGNESLAEHESSLNQDHGNDHDWSSDFFEAEYTYAFSNDLLYPVTVRVIELPLPAEEAQNLLPRGSLPDPSLQLQSLILHPSPDTLLMHWDTYSSITQMMRRFQDHYNTLCEQRATWYYHLNKADNWWVDNILEPLFGLDFNDDILSWVHVTTFTVTSLLAAAIHLPCRWVWNIYAWYFGLGWNGEPEELSVLDEQNSAIGGGKNLWSDMLDAFLVDVAQNLSAERSKEAARAAVTDPTNI